MKVGLLCSMCGVGPAQEKHKCGNSSIYHSSTRCDCCESCEDACWEEYYEMIVSGEADQEVIDYYKGD